MSVDQYECDPCDFWVEKKPRARKDHWCGACSETIPRGDRYVRVNFKQDGEISSLIRCLRCERIYRHLQEKGRPVGMVPCWLLDCGLDYLEEWEEEPPPEIAALAFVTGHDLQEVS